MSSVVEAIQHDSEPFVRALQTLAYGHGIPFWGSLVIREAPLILWLVDMNPKLALKKELK